MSNVSSVYIPDNVGGNNIESMLLGSMLNGGGMGGGQWMNNPIWALVFLGIFSNGNFFGGGNRGNQCAQDLQLQAIREQLTNNQNSSLLMDAIKGNSCALANLATNLNLSKDAVTAAKSLDSLKLSKKTIKGYMPDIQKEIAGVYAAAKQTEESE